jgi:putative flippase GtrA
MTEVQPSDDVSAPRQEASKADSMPRRLARHPLVKYISIGGLCFVIDAGLLWFCTGVLGWDVWLGATIGYWTGVLVNFTLNRTVMAREGGNLLRQTTRYGILLGFNYLVTLAFLHLTAMLGMPVVAGKTVIVAASTCWNYLLYRFWIFV